MCSHHQKKSSLNSIFILLALSIGLISGYFKIPSAFYVAEIIQIVFQKLMKLISVPIIFLSVFSIILKMHQKSGIQYLFKKSIFYTFLTTTIAAIIAIGLILFFKSLFVPSIPDNPFIQLSTRKWNLLDEIIPEHAFQPFMTGNVLSSLLLAILMGIAFTKVSEKEKVEQLSQIFLEGLMKMASFLLKGMPLLIFSSANLSLKLENSFVEFKGLTFFVMVVIGANLIQGIIILPAFLRWEKISMKKTFLGFKDALIYAFFSKSSMATLPIATQCAENNLNISSKVTKFTFPIFTTINMNGCAAFIATSLTLGYLQESPFLTLTQLILILILSVVSAIGNAGVPMGCYFLSTALLSQLGLDLKLIGLILPIYSLIDMLETSLNVWSDSVITTIIDKKIREQKKVEALY